MASRKMVRAARPLARGKSASRPAKSTTDSVREDREIVTTLAKGLAVLGSFGEKRPEMTLSEAARTANVSRAAARRILRTLVSLGYVAHDGRLFSLSPRVLALGFAFLSTESWIEQAEPHLRALSLALDESASAAILDGSEIVYVARSPAPQRILASTIAVGMRLPALHTSLGRVQLGFLDSDELWRRVMSVRVAPYTPSTIVDRAALVARVTDDHAQGFSIVDEEFERGLRSIAVPILTRSGRNVGAIDISSHAARLTRNEMRDRFLPALKRVRDQLALTLT